MEEKIVKVKTAVRGLHEIVWNEYLAKRDTFKIVVGSIANKCG